MIDIYLMISCKEFEITRLHVYILQTMQIIWLDLN